MDDFEKLKKLPPKERIKKLNELKERAKKEEELVKKLLEESKVEASEIERVKERLDLPEIRDRPSVENLEETVAQTQAPVIEQEHIEYGLMRSQTTVYDSDHHDYYDTSQDLKYVTDDLHVPESKRSAASVVESMDVKKRMEDAYKTSEVTSVKGSDRSKVMYEGDRH